jgi:hypothetical protein
MHCCIKVGKLIHIQCLTLRFWQDDPSNHGAHKLIVAGVMNGFVDSLYTYCAIFFICVASFLLGHIVGKDRRENSP